jgi:hypothetical protein
MIRPHKTDVGSHFQIITGLGRPGGRKATRVGVYLGLGGYKLHRFRINNSGRTVLVTEDDILGYRPTVGLRHPPGMTRPSEDRLEDRTFVSLSGGDLSEVLARLRMNPEYAQQIAVTTYEDEPNYASYKPNKEQLIRLGVPIINKFDLRNEQDIFKLKKLPLGSRVHFQMPRVPKYTVGYSTQKLVRDTAMIPKLIDRRDLRISITTPDPDRYKSEQTYNQIYGLESGCSLKGTGMGIAYSKPDKRLEDYDYNHKQSTKDKSTKAAEKRLVYHLTPIVRVKNMIDARFREFNKGDQFECENDPGLVYTVKHYHEAKTMFLDLDWRRKDE